MSHASSRNRVLSDAKRYARWLPAILLATIVSVVAFSLVTQRNVRLTSETASNYHRLIDGAEIAIIKLDSLRVRIPESGSDEETLSEMIQLLSDPSFLTSWEGLGTHVKLIEDLHVAYAGPDYEATSHRIYDDYQAISVVLDGYVKGDGGVDQIHALLEALESSFKQLLIQSEKRERELLNTLPLMQRSKTRNFALFSGGLLLLSLLVLHLITSRWRQQIIAHESNRQLLNDTGELAKVGGWEVDIPNDKLSWTDEVYRIHDLPIGSQSSIEKGIAYYHTEDQPKIAQAVDRLINQRESYDVELRLISEKGVTKWVRTTGSAVVVNGKLTKILGSIQDITKQKTTELQSRLLSRAVEESSAGVLIGTAAGQATYVNKAFERRSGISKDVILATSCHFVDWLFLGENDALEMTKCISEGAIWNGVNDRKDDNRVRIVEDIAVYPMVDETGTPSHFVASLRDVTDRATLEDQQHRSSKMESVGLLAGGIAHDFNNLLGVILGNADLALAKSNPDADVTPFIHEIQSTAMRSAQLTKQLLGFARKQPIEPEWLDLNNEIAELHSMLVRLLGENVSLSWSPAQRPLLVYIDSSQVAQLMVNLTVNARDAIASTGQIRIETSFSNLQEEQTVHGESVQAGRYAVVKVSDNGSGIDPDLLGKIFEPFFTTKERGKSTGLGLSTVFGIVRQNGGFIEVSSTLGEGTTFTISLPMKEDGPQEVEESTVSEQKIRSEARSILLVEDEVALLESTASVLTVLGYDVVAVDSPLKALSEVESGQRSFELLLTDVIMPDLNGKELADRVLERQPEMKCLLVSGYPEDVIGPLSQGGGDYYFLSKPFSMKELGEKLAEVFEA